MTLCGGLKRDVPRSDVSGWLWHLALLDAETR